MERDKKFFRNTENSTGNFEHKRIIVKNPKAKIYPKKDYLVIIDDNELILGYKYISEIYISICNSVPLKYLYKLALIKKVFLIDEYGYIVGEIKCRNL